MKIASFIGVFASLISISSVSIADTPFIVGSTEYLVTEELTIKADGLGEAPGAWSGIDYFYSNGQRLGSLTCRGQLGYLELILPPHHIRESLEATFMGERGALCQRFKQNLREAMICGGGGEVDIQVNIHTLKDKQTHVEKELRLEFVGYTPNPCPNKSDFAWQYGKVVERK